MNTSGTGNGIPDEYQYPREDEWGFAGEIGKRRGDPGIGGRLWLRACHAVEDAFPGAERRFVRNFLRSGFGIHVVDEFCGTLAVDDHNERLLAAALERIDWSRWKPEFHKVERDTREGLWNNSERRA